MNGSFTCFFSGLPHNLNQAEEHYRRACNNGCQQAKSKLKQLQQRESFTKTNSDAKLKSNTPDENVGLKRTKTQHQIAFSSSSPIHASASEPVLRSKTVNCVDDDITVNSGRNWNIPQQLSYLSLFLPYYFNITKSGNTTTISRNNVEMRSKVMFQVGEEIGEECSGEMNQILDLSFYNSRRR